MEFYNGAFVHYGLGNLFFDQMFSLETRQEFVDRHVFYDGKYISTELLTYLSEDYARPRPMTEQERADFLQSIFSVAGW
jgi:poly-gamma-glutamate synthesis protein (capsule biosynthesis protein)